VTGNEGSGLALHVQKAVVGRLLGFQALAPRMSLLESQDCHWAARGLDDCLCRLTDAALNDVDGQGSLASFLQDLLRELQAEVVRFPPDASGAVAGILEELAELIMAFCASPCDLLSQLAAAVAQTAADFYHSCGVAVPPELWDRTEPVFGFLRGKAALSFAPEIHLQARTEFQAEDWCSARVILEIVPRWLDTETIAALPRALLHEYISHVPQGPYFIARTHPDASDGFAEGWMDYVAHCVHRSVLDRRGPSQVLAGCLILTWMGIYDVAAERFFDARSALPDRDPVAAARCEGAAAARHLHDELRRLLVANALQTAANADELLYRLSFGLNASGLSGIARRRVVAEIRRCLLYASRSDLLVDALREWAAGEIKLEDLAARLLG
jgi:hypothetical protein